MHVGAPLVTHEQAAEAVQPRGGTLDHPALGAKPGGAQLAAVGVVVVAAVGEQTRWTAAPRRDRGPKARRRATAGAA